MYQDLEKFERDLSKLAEEVDKETGIEGYDEIIVDDYNDNDIIDDDDDDDDRNIDNDNINNNPIDATNLFGVPDVANVWKKNKKGYYYYYYCYNYYYYHIYYN